MALMENPEASESEKSASKASDVLKSEKRRSRSRSDFDNSKSIGSPRKRSLRGASSEKRISIERDSVRVKVEPRDSPPPVLESASGVKLEPKLEPELAAFLDDLSEENTLEMLDRCFAKHAAMMAVEGPEHQSGGGSSPRHPKNFEHQNELSSTSSANVVASDSVSSVKIELGSDVTLADSISVGRENDLVSTGSRSLESSSVISMKTEPESENVSNIPNSSIAKPASSIYEPNPSSNANSTSESGVALPLQDNVRVKKESQGVSKILAISTHSSSDSISSDKHDVSSGSDRHAKDSDFEAVQISNSNAVVTDDAKQSSEYRNAQSSCCCDEDTNGDGDSDGESAQSDMELDNSSDSESDSDSESVVSDEAKLNTPPSGVRAFALPTSGDSVVPSRSSTSAVSATVSRTLSVASSATRLDTDISLRNQAPHASSEESSIIRALVASGSPLTLQAIQATEEISGTHALPTPSQEILPLSATATTAASVEANSHHATETVVANLSTPFGASTVVVDSTLTPLSTVSAVGVAPLPPPTASVGDIAAEGTASLASDRVSPTTSIPLVTPTLPAVIQATSLMPPTLAVPNSVPLTNEFSAPHAFVLAPSGALMSPPLSVAPQSAAASMPNSTGALIAPNSLGGQSLAPNFANGEHLLSSSAATLLVSQQNSVPAIAAAAEIESVDLRNVFKHEPGTSIQTLGNVATPVDAFVTAAAPSYARSVSVSGAAVACNAPTLSFSVGARTTAVSLSDSCLSESVASKFSSLNPHTSLSHTAASFGTCASNSYSAASASTSVSWPKLSAVSNASLADAIVAGVFQPSNEGNANIAAGDLAPTKVFPKLENSVEQRAIPSHGSVPSNSEVQSSSSSTSKSSASSKPSKSTGFKYKPRKKPRISRSKKPFRAHDRVKRSSSKRRRSSKKRRRSSSKSSTSLPNTAPESPLSVYSYSDPSTSSSALKPPHISTSVSRSSQVPTMFLEYTQLATADSPNLHGTTSSASSSAHSVSHVPPGSSYTYSSHHTSLSPSILSVNQHVAPELPCAYSSSSHAPTEDSSHSVAPSSDSSSAYAYNSGRRSAASTAAPKRPPSSYAYDRSLRPQRPPTRRRTSSSAASSANLSSRRRPPTRSQAPADDGQASHSHDGFMTPPYTSLGASNNCVAPSNVPLSSNEGISETAADASSVYGGASSVYSFGNHTQEQLRPNDVVHASDVSEARTATSSQYQYKGGVQRTLVPRAPMTRNPADVVVKMLVSQKQHIHQP